MQALWVIVLCVVLLGAIGFGVYLLRAVRQRRAAERAETDLLLEDLVQPVRGTRSRQPSFSEDTAPAVLSVPPEWTHPEWEPRKGAGSSSWLH